MKLLNIGNNAKTIKSDKLGKYLTGILYLAPVKISGYSVCPSASKGCTKACLFSAGFGAYEKIRDARINKTKMLKEKPDVFLKHLRSDITKLVNRCNNKLKPAVRLNGTSDIAWEKEFPTLFSDFPKVQFYDYTKSYIRMQQFLDGKLPKNYHLTYSRKEGDDVRCENVLKNGGNVAVVFRNIPRNWKGYRVYDGDKHDLRFTDPHGVVGLRPKGKAKFDTTSFVL